MIQNNRQDSVRVGVVGCGAIAELHHLPALAENPSTRQRIALCDPSAQRLERMRKLFPIEYSCQDYRELVDHVDGVLIATPPHLHYPVAKFFLQKGIPVLCEKPLTELSTEAEELVAISRTVGAGLAVNQTRRFYATNQKIKQLIADGVLGELTSIVYHEGHDFNWPAATGHHFQPTAKGVWSDTGIHLLDSVCYWLGATPHLVESWNDSHGGPESLATVKLQHQSCQIEIKVSRLGKFMNGFRIVGTRGQIESESGDFDEFTVEFHNGKHQRFRCASNRLTYGDFAKPMVQNFVDMIVNRADPIVSGESVLGATQLLEQAYQQAKPYEMPWNRYLPEWRKEVQFGSPNIAQSDDRPARVLITGASGFVGGRLAEAMQLTQLFQPVAGVRAWPRAARVASHPMQIVLCDIMQPDQVAAAAKGCDAIVHCAYSDDLQSISTGTRHVLQAAAQHSISNVVYLSSAEVYGPHHSGSVTESLEIQPLGRPYGDAKLEAEQFCKNFAEEGVNTTILRPSLIYGPHSQSWSMGVADRLQSGNWSLFDGLGEGIANLIYVDDLVRAIFLCLRNPGDRPRVYNVNGPAPLTWNEYFQSFNDALGLPELQRASASKARLKSTAMDLVRGTTSAIKARFEDRLMEIYLRGGLAGRMMKKLKKALDTTPRGGELTDLFSRQTIYNDGKLRKELGYLPQFDIETGIRITIEWMILHELVKHPERSWRDRKLSKLESREAVRA